MPQRTPACQLHARTSGELRQKSPARPALRVTATDQWLAQTTGRIATDAHSWMTAVHWVNQLAKKGLYAPARTHGPKWGPTTVALAQEISALTECRPSVDYLARKLKISERTVQYHLAHLREAGLLVYRSKGTRISGGIRLASHYERIIPAAFDAEFGIRTMQRDEAAPAYTRVPVGAAPEHRKALGKLAKKAARKSRRRGSAKSLSRRGRCTPMQGGTSASSTTALTTVPSENDKLASGNQESPTQQQPKRTPPRGKTILNKVGRRYQLARELVAEVPWLAGAPVARISWIARHVADTGWTVLEVRAVAEDAGPLTRDDARRPVGMLAHRLKGAHQLFNTAERRKTVVDAWIDSRAQERARHDGYENGLHTGGFGSIASRRIADEAMARIRQTLAGCRAGAVAQAVDEVYADAGITVDDLDQAAIVESRMAATQDPGLILAALETGMPEADARRLYSNHLVDLALNAHNTAAANAQPAF